MPAYRIYLEDQENNFFVEQKTIDTALAKSFALSEHPSATIVCVKRKEAGAWRLLEGEDIVDTFQNAESTLGNIIPSTQLRKPEQQESDPPFVGTVLSGCGYITIAVSLIAGLTLAEQIGFGLAAFTTASGGIISGLLLVATGQIVIYLSSINDKLTAINANSNAQTPSE